MLHLHTLGGAALFDSDGALTGSASRRRALALLALIASARDTGLGRDVALALLWPEFDADRARNNLKQLVFSLRRSLSPDVFAATGSVLRLHPDFITVDVWAYEKAVAEGALESAVAHYGGPFLDGFSVPGLVEFARWIETTRERLARVHTETLEALAEQARRSGELGMAAGWCRRLAALDPLSAKHAVSFARALADSGDVAGALRHVYLFERLVHSELDADVGPDMRLLAAELLPRSGAAASQLQSDETAPLDTAEEARVTAEPWLQRRLNAFAAWRRRVRRPRLALAALAVASLIIVLCRYLNPAVVVAP